MGQITNAQWEQLLAAAQDDFEAADSKWKPPVGDYTCLFARYDRNVFQQDDGSEQAIADATFQILEGQHANRTFSERFRFNSPGSVKAFRKFADKMLNLPDQGIEPPAKTLDADTMVGDLAGRIVCLVGITQNGQYFNARLKRVLSVEEEVAAK